MPPALHNHPMLHDSISLNRARRVRSFFLALVVGSLLLAAAPQEDVYPKVHALYGEAKFSKGLKLLNKDAKRRVRAGEEPGFRYHMLSCRGFNGQGNYLLAEHAARAALEVAESPRDQLTAQHGIGVALFANGTADDLQMQEAAKHFRLALEISQGRSNTVRLALSRTLIFLYQEHEALELLNAVVAEAPGSDYAKEAQHLIDDPMRATHVAAPALAFDKVGGGGQTTLADLNGKVVLLDFWATWCKPCQIAIPKLRELAEEHADQPFELISISVDNDPETLKQFIGQNNMTWTQGWDDRGHNARVYGVTGYPAYILLGPDGEILWREQGWSDQVELGIRFEVDRALDALARRRTSSRQDK